MQMIIAGIKIYMLYSFTGRVTDMGKDAVMYNFAQKKPGNAGQNKAWLPVVRVETTTKAFNHILLKSANGDEHIICIRDMDIACREGHELTITWAIRQGEERGPCISIRNNTTLQTFFPMTELKKIFRPPSWALLLVPGFTIVIAYLLSANTRIILLLLLPAFLLGCWLNEWISRLLAYKFRAIFRHERLVK